jgi:hypothetical protein
MDKNTFIGILNSEAESQGWWFVPVEDSWELYREAINNPEIYPPEILHSLIEMDKEDRLIWRAELAERGYEMTPMQVDQYIFIINTAIESDSTDEW